VLASQGDLDGAIAGLRDDLDARAHDASFYAPEHLELAMLYARRGRDAEAIDELGAARAADARWFRANIGRFARTVSASADVDATFLDAVAAASAGEAP
jgi:hypothetical protein